MTAALLCVPAFLFSADTTQTPIERDELYYTYGGCSLASGLSQFHREGWINSTQSSKDSIGWYASPGMLLDIYVRNICGEFTWQYFFNSTADKKISFSHSVYTATGKYVYPISQSWDLTGGAGIYFEGPPAEKEYSGAGGELTAGAIYSYTKFDIKCVFDLRVRYGYYGQNESSRRTDCGVLIGVTRKIGRS
jgi:hypothetical protein